MICSYSCAYSKGKIKINEHSNHGVNPGEVKTKRNVSTINLVKWGKISMDYAFTTVIIAEFVIFILIE